ncbi:MAG: serine/threonine protein kinase [Planctomycetaceae bacterium]|nr:serine/threonine protein kinase [Planctomycetaceae bacterium]
MHDSSIRTRFDREPRAVGRLFHDNVMPVLDVGDVDGTPYFTMPLLAGESLESVISGIQNGQPPLSLDEVVRIGSEIALGLHAAHEQLGIVHRDVKPSNVWLTSGLRRVKLLDFGLAISMVADGTRLTSEHAFVGTFLYMSPEQAHATGDYDCRTDLFSLGLILYELTVGEHPFKEQEQQNTVALLNAIVNITPPMVSSRNPEVPPVLSNLIARLMEKDRERRPQDALTVAEELSRLTANIVRVPRFEAALAAAEDSDDMRLLAAEILGTNDIQILAPSCDIVAITTHCILRDQLRRAVDTFLFFLHVLQQELELSFPDFGPDLILQKVKYSVVQFSTRLNSQQRWGDVYSKRHEMLEQATGEFFSDVYYACRADIDEGSRRLSLNNAISAARSELKKASSEIEGELEDYVRQLREICLT